MAYKFTSGSVSTSGPVSGSGTFYAAGAATLSSTLATTGSVTVGDDLTLGSDSSVFNMGAGNDFTITHDGTTGATIAGNPLTLDSAADITLDAAGDDILLKDAGTHIGNINMGSSNLTIKSIVSDKDMIFQGNDGGAAITALTLDMSEAGAATFNGPITCATSLTIGSAAMVEADLEKIDGITNGAGAANKALVLDANADIASGLRSVTGSGDLKIANVHATGKFYGDGSGLTSVAGTASGSARVYSVAGVETSGFLKVSGAASFADLISGSSGLHVDLPVTFGGIVSVTGAVSGASSTHLHGAVTLGTTLATSGNVTVGNDLTLGSDSSVFNMGEGNDFTITHDGTTGATIAGNPLVLDSGADITLDAAGDDILLSDAGTHVGNINMASSNLTIKSIVSDKDMIFQGNDGGAAITALTLDMSEAGAATFNGPITCATSLTIGSAAMLEADLEKLDGITNGAGAANKALVLDANADIASGLRSVTGSGDLKIANVHATGVFYGNGAGLTGVGNTSETVNTAIANENKTLAAGLNFGLHSLSAVRNWTLPATPSLGDKVIVKAPTGSDWNASLYYVNLTAAGAQIIDGVTSHRINSVGASVTLVCLVAGVSGVWTLI